MSPKSLLITVATIAGIFFLAELAMPGHWERFLTYMEGNLNALSAWVM